MSRLTELQDAVLEAEYKLKCANQECELVIYVTRETLEILRNEPTLRMSSYSGDRTSFHGYPVRLGTSLSRVDHPDFDILRAV